MSESVKLTKVASDYIATLEGKVTKLVVHVECLQERNTVLEQRNKELEQQVVGNDDDNLRQKLSSLKDSLKDKERSAIVQNVGKFLEDTLTESVSIYLRTDDGFSLFYWPKIPSEYTKKSF